MMDEKELEKFITDQLIFGALSNGLPNRPYGGVSTSKDDKCKCPMCKRMVDKANMVEYKQDKHDLQSITNHQIKYFVTSSTIKLCTECENTISTREFYVKLLTYIIFFGSVLLTYLLFDISINKSSYIAFYASFIPAIAAFYMFVSLIIFRSNSMYERVGKLFRIKWKIQQYDIYG